MLGLRSRPDLRPIGVYPWEFRLSDAAKLALSLLAEHGPRIHAVIARITLREDVAEDLLQELFLKLSRRDAILRAVDPVAYAWRAAMRLAFDWRRTQGRRRDTVTLVDEDASNQCSELQRLEQRDDLQNVLDSVSRLPTLQREIVVMRYLEELPFDQIALTIGKTSHQTRALCHKAIMRLRSSCGTTENRAHST